MDARIKSKPEWALQRAIDFSDSDLETNAAGHTSARQLEKLKASRALWAAAMWLAVLGGSGLVIAAIWHGTIIHDSFASRCGIVGLITLIAGAAYGSFWRRYRRYQDDLEALQVLAVQGPVQLHIGHRFFFDTRPLIAQVNNHEFVVSDAVYHAFRGGEPYRIFYTRHSNTILSAFPLAAVGPPVTESEAVPRMPDADAAQAAPSEVLEAAEDAPPQQPRDPSWRLKYEMGFSQRDLDSNREGFLSKAQRQQLYRRRTLWRVISFVLIITCPVVIYLIYQSGVSADKVWQGSAVAIAIAALCFFIALIKQRGYALDLKKNDVRVLKGYAQKGLFRGRNISLYWFTIERRTFRIGKAAYEAIQNHSPYRVYCTVHSGTLLSIEPVYSE